ncbi:hypothetical protein, partial [Clostridium sp.]|uniref:hypothetical protein n=1 Tax=Clostridium sp. TaxID=1506 RepID=UPI00283E2F08
IPYDFPITEVKCDDKDDTELDAIKKKVNKRHCYNLVKNIKTDPSLFGEKDTKKYEKKENTKWDECVFEINKKA